MVASSDKKQQQASTEDRQLVPVGPARKYTTNAPLKLDPGETDPGYIFFEKKENGEETTHATQSLNQKYLLVLTNIGSILIKQFQFERGKI